MADMTADRSRGQLILVAGVAIAVAIVVLVLLLNSVIYSQNLATRSVDAGDQAAIDYRNTMVDGARGLLAAENDGATDRAALGSSVHSGVERLAGVVRVRNGQDAAVATLTGHTVHNGTRLVQANRTREMTSAGGKANWTLARGADGVRSFEVQTAADSLAETDAIDRNATRITVTGGGGAEWRLYLYENLAGQARVAVQNASASRPTEVCTPVGDSVRVDLTAGTVDGSPCPQLVFGKGASAPYDVSVAFGNRTSAAYNLTVNTTVDTPQFNGPGSTTDPYEVPAVYSLAMDLTYRTPDLLYETRVVVTPEGSDD